MDFVGIRQAVQNTLLVRRKVSVVAGIQTGLFHELPQSFDQVEMRRIRRKENKFDAQGLRFRLHQLATLVTGVVHYDLQRNAPVRMSLPDFSQQFTNRIRVDVILVHDHQKFLIQRIDRPQDVQPTSTGRRLNEHPFFRPHRTHHTTHDKMSRVGEIRDAFAVLSRQNQWFKRFF